MDLNKLIGQDTLDNMLVKVWVYDNDLKCVPDPNTYDLVLIKDFKSYCEQHKGRLYDTQFFVKGN